MVTSTTQIFSSGSCVQQHIIPERLNQIYIASNRWKEKILVSYKQLYLSLVSNFRGRATFIARHVTKKVCLESILYFQLVLINQH